MGPMANSAYPMGLHCSVSLASSSSILASLLSVFCASGHKVSADDFICDIHIGILSPFMLLSNLCM